MPATVTLRTRYNAVMAQAKPRAMTDEERNQMRQWLDNWARTGPLLERMRWERLRGMSDEEARRDARLVWDLWQPDWPADNGEGLLLHQRVFARARTNA